VYRGLKRVDQNFKLTMTASNVVRMARILVSAPQGATTAKASIEAMKMLATAAATLIQRHITRPKRDQRAVHAMCAAVHRREIQ
jgi:hypothetical protein